MYIRLCRVLIISYIRAFMGVYIHVYYTHTHTHTLCTHRHALGTQTHACMYTRMCIHTSYMSISRDTHTMQCTYTRVHTWMHTCACVRARIHTCACRHTRHMCLSVHRYTHIHPCVHAHACVHNTWVPICAHAHLGPCIHWIDNRVRARAHVICAHMHTCVCVYIHHLHRSHVLHPRMPVCIFRNAVCVCNPSIFIAMLYPLYECPHLFIHFTIEGYLDVYQDFGKYSVGMTSKLITHP